MDTLNAIRRDLAPYLLKCGKHDYFEFDRNELFQERTKQFLIDNTGTWSKIINQLSPVLDESYGLSQGYFSAVKVFGQENQINVRAFLRVNTIYKSYCVYFEEALEINGWYIRPKEYVADNYKDEYEKAVRQLNENGMTEYLPENESAIFSPYLRLSPRNNQELLFQQKSVEAMKLFPDYPCLLELKLLNSILNNIISYDENGNIYHPTVFESLFNLNSRGLLEN
ncbi:hypothetical protein [Spirosoma montaniterrae]|nr:hypothetical protein [Spirosoma montaniterrae]